MAIQYSVTVNNARLDSVEATIGASPTLEMRTGAPPANCAAADSGTVLATVVLPADWMNAASGASKTKLGTWQDASADAAGTVGHYRIKQGATCHEQGTVTATGGGGDMTVDNVVFAVAQSFTVNTYTKTSGNQ